MPELSDELGTETGNGDLEKRHKEHKMYLKVNYKKQILCYLVPEGQAKKKKNTSGSSFDSNLFSYSFTLSTTHTTRGHKINLVTLKCE